MPKSKYAILSCHSMQLVSMYEIVFLFSCTLVLFMSAARISLMVEGGGGLDF